MFINTSFLIHPRTTFLHSFFCDYFVFYQCVSYDFICEFYCCIHHSILYVLELMHYGFSSCSSKQPSTIGDNQNQTWSSKSITQLKGVFNIEYIYTGKVGGAKNKQKYLMVVYRLENTFEFLHPPYSFYTSHQFIPSGSGKGHSPLLSSTYFLQ